MSNAKRATASVKANPKRPMGNRVSRAAGFRAMDEIRLEKILPIPIPTPIKATTARPAPIILADSTSILVFLSFSKLSLNVGVKHHEGKDKLGS